MEITVTVNGVQHTLDVEPRTPAGTPDTRKS